jgi:hypothetical protein
MNADHRRAEWVNLAAGLGMVAALILGAPVWAGFVAGFVPVFALATAAVLRNG